MYLPENCGLPARIHKAKFSLFSSQYINLKLPSITAKVTKIFLTFTSYQNKTTSFVFIRFSINGWGRSTTQDHTFPSANPDCILLETTFLWNIIRLIITTNVVLKKRRWNWFWHCRNFESSKKVILGLIFLIWNYRFPHSWFIVVIKHPRFVCATLS